MSAETKARFERKGYLVFLIACVILFVRMITCHGSISCSKVSFLRYRGDVYVWGNADPAIHRYVSADHQAHSLLRNGRLAMVLCGR